MSYDNQGKVYFFYEDEPTNKKRANVFEQAEDSPATLARLGYAVVQSSSGYTYVMPPERYLEIRARLDALRKQAPVSDMMLPETRLLKNAAYIQVRYIEDGSDSDSDSDDARNWVAVSEFYSFGNFTGGDTLSFDRFAPAEFEQHVGKKLHMVQLRITASAVVIVGVGAMSDA